MLQQFDTVEETNHRLAGSTILYKGQPMYVHEARGKPITLSLLPVPIINGSDPNNTIKIPLSDPDLSQVFNGLGYINYTKAGVAVYSSRMPARGRYRQGLYESNLHVKVPQKTGRVMCRYQELIYDPGFNAMLTHKYPKLEEAVERVLSATFKETTNQYGEITKLEGTHSVAFDRLLAIERDDFRGDMLLSYKGEPIGFGLKQFNIKSEFKHLREALDEKGVKIL